MSPPPTIEVAVCTYRRAGVVDTLASLDHQNLPGNWTMAVLVVDNDDTPSAREAVLGFASQARHEVRYIHCPAGNISVARNGALAAARSRFLAFIDDDERAEVDWLHSLFAAQQAEGADVVLGPVRAVYRDDAPYWLRRLDPHSTAPVHAGGAIRTGYSCNVLMDLSSPAFAGARFDTALGRSGGEDTAFFTHAYRRGAIFAEAPSAVVTEEVPAERARLGWLARRRFRSGQTHARLLAETETGGRRAAAAALATLKVGYCVAAAMLALPRATARNRALLRGCLHLGTLGGLLGARPITLYGPDAEGAAP